MAGSEQARTRLALRIQWLDGGRRLDALRDAPPAVNTPSVNNHVKRCSIRTQRA